MNCLYLLRGAAGGTLQQPQFTNSPIWMFGNEYKTSFIGELEKLNQLLNSINENNTNNNNNNNNNDSSSSENVNEKNDIELNSVNNNNNNNVDNNNNGNNEEEKNKQQQQQPTDNKKNINSGAIDIQDQFIKDFLEDFTTRVLWFTYRQGFPFIDNTQYDNDCGWGCMLRSGQMLLSNLLLHHALGDDWKKSSNQTHPDVYHNIISMFLDKPSAPFSIHNIAMEGQTLGKNIGEWFAPSIISQAIKALVSKNYEKCNISVFISEDGSLYIDQLLNISLKKKKQSIQNKDEQQQHQHQQQQQQQQESEQPIREKQEDENIGNLENIDNNNNNNNNNINNTTETTTATTTTTTITPTNNEDQSQQLQQLDSSEEELLLNSKEDFSFDNIDSDEISDNSSKEEEIEIWEPLLILIPMRLGLEGLNSIYYSSLLEIFKFPQNLGVVGGKPRASLYFIAAQDDNLFYLDPHTPQNYIENLNSTNNNNSSGSSDSVSYFSSSPSSLPTILSSSPNSGTNNNRPSPVNTFFCNQTKRTHVSEVDPSLVVAFFCKNREDFDDFVKRSKKMAQMENPIFSIFDQCPDYFGKQDKFSMGEESDEYDEENNSDEEDSEGGSNNNNGGGSNDENETSDDIDDYHLIN